MLVLGKSYQPSLMFVSKALNTVAYYENYDRKSFKTLPRGQPPRHQDLLLREQQVQDGLLPAPPDPPLRSNLLRRGQPHHLPGALQVQPHF